MPGWNEFEIRIPVEASMGTIYNAWTTSRGLERWFLRKATFKSKQGALRLPDEPFEKGDRYHWLWFGYGDDVFEANRVLNANGVDFMRFEFTGKCIVTVRMESTGNMTLVSLKQDRIPDDPNPSTNLFVNCQLGWTFYLTNLKSVLEGGRDLRNKDTGLMPVINS